MSAKPYRVITPSGTRWMVRFKTEQAAWGRVLSGAGMIDRPANRAELLRLGWRVKTTEPAGIDLGGNLHDTE